MVPRSLCSTNSACRYFAKAMPISLSLVQPVCDISAPSMICCFCACACRDSYSCFLSFKFSHRCRISTAQLTQALYLVFGCRVEELCRELLRFGVQKDSFRDDRRLHLQTVSNAALDHLRQTQMPSRIDTGKYTLYESRCSRIHHYYFSGG